MKTSEQLDDEHWNAAQNSKACYDVAIKTLRERYLNEQKGAGFFPSIGDGKKSDR